MSSHSQPTEATTNALFVQLLERLTAGKPDHDSFRGAPVDITGLTPLELGRLWPAIQRASWDNVNVPARELAHSILRQAKQRDLAPTFDAVSGIESFRLLGVGAVDPALEYLASLACEPPEGLAEQLRRILGDSEGWADSRYKVFVLTRLLDEPSRAELEQRVHAKYGDSPLVLREFALLEQLGRSALLSLAMPRHVSYYWAAQAQEKGDPAIALADDAAYVDFSEKALSDATQRLNEIHRGTVPYEADGAFSIEDAHIIARAARVAALRDEPWFRELIGDLFPKACLAPTDAKSCPSQSLAIALGHSIEGVPTPESVRALREALGVVRHAGVKKKLSRNIKPAERALVERPEIALRLTADTKPGKKHQALLATCLEAGFWANLDMSWEDWCRKLALPGSVAQFTRALIWRAQDSSGQPVSFMLDGDLHRLSTIDCNAHAIAVTESSRISLWHPLTADETERDAWRSLISERKIRQPIRQAYREYYLPEIEETAEKESSMFAGHVLSLVPLIGLARREGWQIEKEGSLIRRFGNLRILFGVGADLYPGVQGWGESSGMIFQKRQGSRWQSIAIREIPPITFSEMGRAVDLLVSVAGFALEDTASTKTRSLHPQAAARGRHIARMGKLRVGEMASMRRVVLKRVFEREIVAGTVAIDSHHVRVRAFSIHLATARVTRDGAPIDLDLPKGNAKLAAVPWLPYDEVLLERIVDSVAALLGGHSGDTSQ